MDIVSFNILHVFNFFLKFTQNLLQDVQNANKTKSKLRKLLNSLDQSKYLKI